MTLRNEKIRNMGETNENREELSSPLYYIISDRDDTVLVGMDVTIQKVDFDDTSIIKWYDTRHERSMTAVETYKNDDYFAFKRSDEEGGQAYYFQPLTLDVYNKEVKKHYDNPRDFNSYEEMLEAYQETKNDY